jgi:hypothetical protein
MSENTHRGPSLGLLLLIPAAAIVAKATMRHHRAMWSGIPGPEGTAPTGAHGHRHGPWRDFGPDARESFRLPPRIEWMLDTWHERAHQSSEPETTTV